MLQAPLLARATLRASRWSAFRIGLVAFGAAARAQDASELRELALAIDAHDAGTTRSLAQGLGSLVLFLDSGAVAVFGSLPTLASGRRVFPGIAGAYGLSLGALAASLAGAGWQVRSRAIAIAGAIVATLTGAAGILSITLLPEKRGRFFGGGLTIGAGLGALWTIGAFAHLRHHREANDAWRELLRGLSVGADRRGARLGWQTRF